MAVLSARESEPVSSRSEEVKQVLTAVRLNYPFIAFGINSSQLSNTMAGISIRYQDGCVLVRHSGFKNKEKRILPPGICELTFEDLE